jgi:hypothetical protein
VVHETAQVLNHGYRLNPDSINGSKAHLFLLRSWRAKSGLYKRRLQASEVLTLYYISDVIAKGLTG